jgi:hypothetical protein
MNSSKHTVWCATSAKEIVGPFFFEESTFDQQNFLDMLKTTFYPFLQKKKDYDANYFST